MLQNEHDARRSLYHQIYNYDYHITGVPIEANALEDDLNMDSNLIHKYLKEMLVNGYINGGMGLSQVSLNDKGRRFIITKYYNGEVPASLTIKFYAHIIFETTDGGIFFFPMLIQANNSDSARKLVDEIVNPDNLNGIEKTLEVCIPILYRTEFYRRRIEINNSRFIRKGTPSILYLRSRITLLNNATRCELSDLEYYETEDEIVGMSINTYRMPIRCLKEGYLGAEHLIFEIEQSKHL